MFKCVFLLNLSWNLYCRFNGLSTVNTLLERGADPSVKGRKGDTALHFAARRGNEEIVKILLQHSKVNVNDKDASGKTALHLACNEGHSNVCQLLLNYGADIKAVSEDKTTPLHSAILNGHSQVAIMILNRGKRWSIDSSLISILVEKCDLWTCELIPSLLCITHWLISLPVMLIWLFIPTHRNIWLPKSSTIRY